MGGGGGGGGGRQKTNKVNMGLYNLLISKVEIEW